VLVAVANRGELRVGGKQVAAAVMVVLQLFFFSVRCSSLCLSLFLLLLSFLTVQVLLSTTGRTVAAGGGSGGCGRRPRWREKQRGKCWLEPEMFGFLADFGPNFLHPWSMKIKYIYR
jgi:hypothetical protein